MTAAHKLPADLHEQIYSKIAREYLSRATPQEAPVAILTGGQPGSGKSGIAHTAKRELQAQGGFVLVDADEVRSWHPEYHALLRLDDTTAANKTHPDAGAWAGRLGRDAIASKRNVIFDQTSKDPRAVLDLARKLHEAGYRVELRVMAVNRLISEQRIHMRYEAQKAATGHGRFSTRDNHDIAFAGVLKTVAVVEASQAVDVIKVYDKDHRGIYIAELDGGAWSRQPAAAATVDAERSRPLTLAERGELVVNYERIGRMLEAPERRASPAEVGTVAGLADQAQRHYLGQAVREGQDHPALGQVTEILGRMGEQADSQGLRGAARDQALTLGREILARSIERGEPLNKVAQEYLTPGLARPDRGSLER